MYVSCLIYSYFIVSIGAVNDDDTEGHVSMMIDSPSLIGQDMIIFNGRYQNNNATDTKDQQEDDMKEIYVTDDARPWDVCWINNNDNNNTLSKNTQSDCFKWVQVSV